MIELSLKVYAILKIIFPKENGGSTCIHVYMYLSFQIFFKEPFSVSKMHRFGQKGYLRYGFCNRGRIRLQLRVSPTL